jgi:hypothetical protein
VIARRDLAARLGIFARTFRRDTAAEVASAISAAGYPLAHWNFAAIGRETLGGDVSDELVASVRADFDTAGLSIPSVSATYNVIRVSRQADCRRGSAHCSCPRTRGRRRDLVYGNARHRKHVASSSRQRGSGRLDGSAANA